MPRPARCRPSPFPATCTGPTTSTGGAPPVGFGLFRAIDDGYELWLAGLEASLRGRGHGRAMLKALFATDTGRKTKFMRVRSAARYAKAITHLLAEHGFTPTRETHNETWFVRASVTAPSRREPGAARVDRARSCRRPGFRPRVPASRWRRNRSPNPASGREPQLPRRARSEPRYPNVQRQRGAKLSARAAHLDRF